MSTLRIGLRSSHRGVISCALSRVQNATRSIRIQRRFFALSSTNLNQSSSVPSRWHESDPQNANIPINAQILQNDDLGAEHSRNLVNGYSSQLIKVNGVEYHPLFLRDSCDCHLCVDPSTKQKNFQTSDIPSMIQATSIGSGLNGDLEVFWENDIPSYGSNHVSSFSKNFFEIHKSSRSYGADRYSDNAELITWDAELIAKKLQYVTYDDYINTEEGLYRALLALRHYGLLILRDVPGLETSVVDIAKRIGNLRDTLYGATWDVKSVSQAKNIAYTSRSLGLHMDLLYMKNPPGFQFLHCLRNTCSGGSSIFSDAFHAAKQLDPASFTRLVKYKIGYQYRNADEHYYHKHPVLELLRWSKGRKVLLPQLNLPRAVNYSPPFQATSRSPDDLLLSNDSLKQFSSLVESPMNMYEYRLQEGECVIFNNRRVLHGRKEFDTSNGERWFKGTYIDTDVFESRYRVLSEKYKDLGSTVGARTHGI